MTAPTSGRRTSILPTREGGIEYLVTGSGTPTTVFAHGLAGTIDTTRPFGGGVQGTKVFFHFRGHGASSAPESPWTYAALAGELDSVAQHTAATQAVGVSMGAGAICGLLEEDPGRFERIVLLLPAVLDTARRDAALERMLQLAQLAQERDVEGVLQLLLAEQPAGLRTRPDVLAWSQQQARTIVATEVGRALRTIPRERAMLDRRALARVTVPVLVLTQEDDPAHPVAIAEEIARLIPDARLEVFPPGGMLWQHRDRVRRAVGTFLSREGG